MALQDLAAKGVDLTNIDAIDQQMLGDTAPHPNEVHEYHAQTEEVVAAGGPAGIETEITAEAAPAAADPVTEAPAAEAAPATAGPTDAERIATLTRELTELKAKQAAAPAPAPGAKSEAAQKRDTRLQKLIETVGEDHPLVEIERDRNAEADAQEAAMAAASAATTDAQITSARVLHTKDLPLLKDMYDRMDATPADGQLDPDTAEMLDIAAAVSARVQADPKLAGTAAAQPHTREHYKAVEDRLAARFPDLKAKFYPGAAPASAGGDATPKPKAELTLRSVPGGQAPVPRVKQAPTLAELAVKALADPSVSIDQLLAQVA